MKRLLASFFLIMIAAPVQAQTVSTYPSTGQAVITKLGGMTGAASVTLPAGAYITGLMANNNTGNAVLGGLKVGTTAGGADVYTSIAVAANALNVNVVPLKNFFSFTNPQTIYIDAVTLFNNANIDFFILYRPIFNSTAP